MLHISPSLNLNSNGFEVVYIHGYPNGIKKRNDFYLPLFTKNLDKVKQFELRKDDYFSNGYPKTGTTLMEEIAWLILNDLDFETSKSVPHNSRVPFVDFDDDLISASQAKSPRVFHTHLPLEFFPDSILFDSKMSYMIRNPKDVAVSSYFFFSAFKLDPIKMDIQDYLELFLEGKVFYGSYWNHVLSFLNKSNVFIMTYEQLIENKYEVIKEFAQFLDRPLNQTQIKEIISYTEFANMKQLKAFDLQLTGHFEKDFSFFRKGQVGDWRNYFSEEMSKRYDEKTRTELNSLAKLYCES